MLDEKHRLRLRGGLATARHEVELILHDGEGAGSLADLLAELAAEVEAVGGGAVTWRKAGGQDAGAPMGPALTISTPDRANLHYLALPEGLEVEPFVDVLLELAQGGARETEDWAAFLEDLEPPAELLVFVSAACPHCAHAVRAAQKVALASPQVSAVVVDAQRFEELAAEHEVTSVPLTLVDRELGVSGAVSPGELAERILSRGSPEYGMRLLVSLLEAGRMSDAVKRMAEAGGATEFAQAWRRSAMSLRMGLMLLATEVMDGNRAAMDPVVVGLLPALDAEDDGLRGDTADLLGQIGHASAIPALEAHLGDANSEVAEVAADALEQIRERSAS